MNIIADNGPDWLDLWYEFSCASRNFFHHLLGKLLSVMIILCFIVPELYFTLSGTVYLPGDSVLITDIGEFTSQTLRGGASSLVCDTSNVNRYCCRASDGGSVGEWFFPNGTMVLRNSGNENADFTRSGFTHQVRLNRRNNALMPTGEYLCTVPHVSREHINATITLIVGKCIMYIGITCFFNVSYLIY